METHAARHCEPALSLREIGVSKLRALGRALELREPSIRSAVETFDLMASPWSALNVGDVPPWPNDITDDGTPFEFSVALEGTVCELRMLLESQSLPVTPRSSWRAGLALQARLEQAQLLSLTRFREIQELFRPLPRSQAHFSLWHAAVLREPNRPLFKAYVNPAVRGKDSGPAVVQQALVQLGMGEAWEFLNERLRRFAAPDIRYFALDLDDAKSARVKVYVASESTDEVEALLRGVVNFTPGQATDLLSVLVGTVRPLASRPILSCFAFTSEQAEPTATLHVPIRCYVDDDAQAARRITSLLSADGGRRLKRTLAAAANRPLDMARGLITYASLRPAPDQLRVTVYLAPQAYAIAEPRKSLGTLESVSPPSDRAKIARSIMTMSDVRAEIADRCRSFANHSLFTDLDNARPKRIAVIVPQIGRIADVVRNTLRVSCSYFEDPTLGASVMDEEFETLLSLVRATACEQHLRKDVLPAAAEERKPVRDSTYDQLAQLLLPTDDFARLAAAWSVAILSSVLFRKIVASLSGKHEPTACVVEAALNARTGRDPDHTSVRAQFLVPPSSSQRMLHSIEGVTEAMLRLLSELKASLESPPIVAERTVLSPAEREPTPLEHSSSNNGLLACKK